MQSSNTFVEVAESVARSVTLCRLLCLLCLKLVCGGRKYGEDDDAELVVWSNDAHGAVLVVRDTPKEGDGSGMQFSVSKIPIGS